MKLALALGLGLLFLQAQTEPTSHPAMDHDWSQIQMMDYQSGNGVPVRYSVTAERAGAQPSWNPEMGPPPLDLSKAVEMARKSILARKPKFDDVRVMSLHMNRLGHGQIKDRWYYVIEFEPVIDGEDLIGSDAREVILMDGTIVEPVILNGRRPSHAADPPATPDSRPAASVPASSPTSSATSPAG